MDLSPENVRALARVLGLDLTTDDVAEVTHRLNGMLDALGPLAGLPLHTVEPVPSSPDVEGSG